MKGKVPFQRSRRLETIYQAEIQALTDAYMKSPNFSTLGELNAKLVEFGQATDFFKALATRLATRMVTMIAVSNARNWRAAASQGSKGARIYQMLQDNLRGGVGLHIDHLIHQNSQLITSLPQNIAHMISHHIYTQQMQGIRSSEIMKQISPYMQKAKRYQIQRLARTEVAKADTAITRARAQDIGLNWYQWHTSEDARVRKSHRKLDLVLVNWDEAPSPEVLAGERSEGHYHAGNIYNCRCVALPVVRLNQVSFPAKIYHNGRLQRMSLRQFALISGMHQLVA